MNYLLLKELLHLNKFLIILLIIILSSCSFVDKDKKKPEKKNYPTIILEDATYTIINKSDNMVVFQAKELINDEQNQNASLTNLIFTQSDEQGQTILHGSCDEAKINTKSKAVELFGDVIFNHLKETIFIKSDYLSWDTDKKILKSKDDKVLKLSYDNNINISGKGFLGDLENLRFDFKEQVKGEISEKNNISI